VKVSSIAKPSGVTTIVVVEVSDPPLPLVMTHMKITSPIKFGIGSNVKPPCTLNVRVPEFWLDPSILQVCTLKTSLGPERSFARRPGALTVNGCSGGIVKESSRAKPSGVTKTVAVEVSVSPLPFEIVHVKLVTPTKLGKGINVKPPCVSKVTLPSSAPVQVCTLKTSFGPGLSFARIPGALTVSGCPGKIVKVSSTAKPSGVTRRVVVEVSVPPLPLEMVHIKVVNPIKFAMGVNVKPPCASEFRLPLLDPPQFSTLKTSLGPGVSFARIPGALTMNG